MHLHIFYHQPYMFDREVNFLWIIWRYSKTGLGLSVSYGIIKSHDGEIIIESELGEGSTITLIFPILRKFWWKQAFKFFLRVEIVKWRTYFPVNLTLAPFKPWLAFSLFSSETTCSISCIGFLGFQQYLKANDTPTDDLDDKDD